jgi:PKD repeat protein
MRYEKVIFLGLIGILFCLNIVFAGFTKGNPVSDISTSYAPGAPLSGWINISLKDEDPNSILSAFNSNINLLDFLNNCSVNYTCSPTDCGNDYSESNMETEKSFSLNNFGDTKLIGLKITSKEKFESVSNISMTIKSNAGEEIFPQLFVDILDDNLIDWQANFFSGKFGNKNYGCFESNQTMENVMIVDNKLYCERITIPTSPSLIIGANVIKTPDGGGFAEFEMNVFKMDLGFLGSCKVNTSTSGEISCIVNQSVDSKTDFFVCINVKNSGYNNKYNLRSETNNPCGARKVGTNLEAENYYDFEIFVKSGTYGPIGTFTLKNDNINTDIKTKIGDYILDKYDNNCTDGCIIPIRFKSGSNGQEVDVSNVLLFYYAGNPGTIDDLYDLTEKTATIDMSFQKLELINSDLLVPYTIGTTKAIIKLNGREITNKSIEIKPFPIIVNIIPDTVPILVPVTLTALLENSTGNLTYEWDFGDGSKNTTITNTVRHKFNSIREYNLTLKVRNNYGESTKIVKIKTTSPNVTAVINQYRQDIDNFNKKLNTLNPPQWIRNIIENTTDTAGLISRINDKERSYNSSLSIENVSINIINDLLSSRIPYDLEEEKAVPFSPLFAEGNKLDLGSLKDLGAGNYQEASNDEYADAINSWIASNLYANYESTTYFIYYRDSGKETLFSSVILKLEIKQQGLGDIYSIINGNPNEIKFKDSLNVTKKDNFVGIIFKNLDENKTIEFLYPSEIKIENTPFYISPKFSKLDVIPPNITCNNNGECEKELGENTKTCSGDCESNGITIVFIILLLFIAFVFYIILQEWYKKNYERKLFKDRNELYNLINFMSISENQGMKRGDINKSLKKLKWNGEQMDYAWNKLHGKRTGMWEIPIFKIFEKKEVKREIEKRQIINPKPNNNLGFYK